MLFRPVVFAVVLVFVVSCQENSGKKKAGQVDYAFDVKPILSDRCYKCHGPDEAKRESNLRLDTEAGALAMVGEKLDHVIIVRGKADSSELVKRIYSDDPDLQMPPPDSKLALTDHEKEILKKWIDQGAQWKPHWAFQKPVKSKLPEVTRKKWPRNEIDYFTLAKMEEMNLNPSSQAEDHILARRMAFDITGLPPLPHLLDQLMASDAEDRFENYIDSLFKQPSYGENQASAWLDLARYGDTHGYQDDLPRIMWPWRDWVIHAFNRNMPYDQFVTWQLAGDLLPDATKEQLLASAFNRNHKITQEGGVIDEEYRVEYVADRTNTFSKAFLGLTMECARCHDHKYDPISTEAYYQTFAFFNQVPETGFVQNQTTPKPWMPISKKDIEGVLHFVNARKVIRNEQDTIEQMVMKDDRKAPRKTFILKRGSYEEHGKEVRPSGLGAVLPYDTAALGSDRTGLAKWLFSKDHPLTSRVLVNRIWQHLFGRGLVSTSDDFGSQGSLPTHPQLLDWLAVDMIEHGWDIQYMMKKIMTSATYRQQSNVDGRSAAQDPENKFLARGPRYRMNYEMIRDNVLAASGLLNREIGGPSVKPYQPPGLWEELTVGGDAFRGEAGYKMDKGDNQYRRSLYTYWRRTIPPPTMMTFDNPQREFCEVKRVRTSTPLQALVMLNDPQVLEASRVLAYNIMEAYDDPGDRLKQMFRRVLSRLPGSEESGEIMAYYKAQKDRYTKDRASALKLLSTGQSPHPANVDPAESAAWMMTGSLLFNLDESLTKY